MQFVAALLSVSRSVAVATDKCGCRECNREGSGSVVWFILSPCSMFLDDLLNFRVLPALHGTVSVLTTQLTLNLGHGVGHFCVQLGLVAVRGFQGGGRLARNVGPVLDSRDHVIHGHAVRIHRLGDIARDIGVLESLGDMYHKRLRR